MSAKKGILSGERRAEFGCIMTFENDKGQRLTIHSGNERLTDGIRRACDAALAADPSRRVISYSTPETINTDLQGRTTFEMFNLSRHPPLAEHQALGRVRLTHLLHPRLCGDPDMRKNELRRQRLAEKRAGE